MSSTARRRSVTPTRRRTIKTDSAPEAEVPFTTAASIATDVTSGENKFDIWPLVYFACLYVSVIVMFALIANELQYVLPKLSREFLQFLELKNHQTFVESVAEAGQKLAADPIGILKGLYTYQ